MVRGSENLENFKLRAVAAAAGKTFVCVGGKCDGDKWWSFDFTSLYPAMCAKHDMPYGKPEPMNKSNWA